MLPKAEHRHLQTPELNVTYAAPKILQFAGALSEERPNC
jgi:hypothetical protein